MWELAWFIVKVIVCVWLILHALPIAIMLAFGFIGWIISLFNNKN